MDSQVGGAGLLGIDRGEFVCGSPQVDHAVPPLCCKPSESGYTSKRIGLSGVQG